MNGSKRYWPSGAERTSGELPVRFAQRASPFPLTPALSLGERENPPLSFSTTRRGVCPTNLANDRSCRRLTLSQWERVRVRGIEVLFNKRTRSIPGIVELCE